jgi:DNA-directed RNA polymerase subunit RPC12/RpoP
MQIHKYRPASLAISLLAFRAQRFGPAILFPCLIVFLTFLMGCKKEAGLEAIETDANGYVCLKCGAKLYTDRKVFMGPKCPQCNEDTLVEVVGYYCQKDNHLTIRARRGDRRGPICEKCQATLVNAMKDPHEKDLKAWGAAKVKG